jgi:hypothetical protein
LLARVANARRTQDIDLYREGSDKDESLAALVAAAILDLGDFFAFAYHSHSPIAIGDNQPSVDGYRVVFTASLGIRRLAPIKIDLAASVFTSVGLVRVDPANRLPLPRLMAFPYRLYPVANQIADKVTASIAEYRGKPSSREKDLVDLVVLALTQSVEAVEVRDAILTECHLRRLPVPAVFAVPSAWGATYAKLAAGTAPLLGTRLLKPRWVSCDGSLTRCSLVPHTVGGTQTPWNGSDNELSSNRTIRCPLIIHFQPNPVLFDGIQRNPPGGIVPC